MLDRSLPAIVLVVGIGISCLSCLWAAENSGSSETPDKAVDLMENPDKPKFYENLPPGFEHPSDVAGELLLREYGAVFVARNGAVPPKKIFFENESDVQAFQASVGFESEKFGAVSIELQKAATRAIRSAANEAKKQGLSISPRGADSGRRGYDQTIRLWNSRVEPGLTYWVGKGRLKASEADLIRRMPIRQQIDEILRLEKEGIFFAKSLDKSIIYSVAPPGSSQHIAMLAFDVKEFDDARVRAILGEHGWFQTVVSDLPHFTYLGVKESELPRLGLRKVNGGSRNFWVPDITASKPN